MRLEDKSKQGSTARRAMIVGYVYDEMEPYPQEAKLVEIDKMANINIHPNLVL